MDIIKSIYYGILTISMIYFLLFLSSIIRNFSNILGIKVLVINPVPSESDNMNIPLEDLSSLSKEDHQTITFDQEVIYIVLQFEFKIGNNLFFNHLK